MANPIVTHKGVANRHPLRQWCDMKFTLAALALLPLLACSGSVRADAPMSEWEPDEDGYVHVGNDTGMSQYVAMGGLDCALLPLCADGSADCNPYLTPDQTQPGHWLPVSVGWVRVFRRTGSTAACGDVAAYPDSALCYNSYGRIGLKTTSADPSTYCEQRWNPSTGVPIGWCCQL